MSTTALARSGEAGGSQCARLDQRNWRRIKTFFPTVVVLDRIPHRAHVLDISPIGSRLHIGFSAQLGSQICFRFNDTEVVAKVVWSDAGRIGLRFRTELRPDQLSGALTE